MMMMMMMMDDPLHVPRHALSCVTPVQGEKAGSSPAPPQCADIGAMCTPPQCARRTRARGGIHVLTVGNITQTACDKEG